jgi:hypothetical protein
MVIGVAAVDNNDQKAKFSNYGQQYADISAPGTKVYSTLFHHSSDPDFKDYYGGYWSGTSVAAPLVAGTAALVKSVNQNLTNAQIRDIIMKNADNIEAVNSGYEGKLGGGRLNAYQAVRAAFLMESVSLSDAHNIAVGSGFGGGPQVRVLRTDGTAVSSFFAYDSKFRGGVNVAVGDFDKDNKEEIIVSPADKGGPQVRVFDYRGNVKRQFFAFDESFRGGVKTAAGDIDGDGSGEIVAAISTKGEKPLIRIFSAAGGLKAQFLAYGDSFRGGVNVSVGDVAGSGEIIVGPAGGAEPQVRIFDSSGNPLAQFLAYAKTFLGGVKVAAMRK